MKKVFSDYRCWRSDIIREVVKFLEGLKEDEYINKPLTIVVEVIDENEEDSK